MSRAALVLALAALAAAALAAPAPASVLGIADQKAEMFADPRFAELGVRHSRYSVGWDVLDSAWQTEQLERWLEGAALAGVEPLITFGHSRGEGRRRVLPEVSRLKYEFRRFRARYPHVTTFATWNEANHCGQPTCHRAPLVASYWRAMTRECPTCTILPAELLDMPNMVRWVKEFRRAARTEPDVWGLHNYVDANRRRRSGTQALLDNVDGDIWLTETGGIVGRRNKSRVPLEESPEAAARALRWLFGRIVPMSGRITRVYVYHWTASSDFDTWDSALFGPDGLPRPGFAVLREYLGLGLLRR